VRHEQQLQQQQQRLGRILECRKAHHLLQFGNNLIVPQSPQILQFCTLLKQPSEGFGNSMQSTLECKHFGC
jgi:hypothetical protein